MKGEFRRGVQSTASLFSLFFWENGCFYSEESADLPVELLFGHAAVVHGKDMLPCVGAIVEETAVGAYDELCGGYRVFSKHLWYSFSVRIFQ